VPAPESGPVRILGLDPGSRRTGFGVIECVRGGYTHVAHGCLNVGGGEMPERLRRIFAGLTGLITEHRPAEVAVERVFVNRNVQAALKLGQARGAALCAIPAGLTVFEYTPSAVKQALAGTGGAGKGQVRHMIQALLRLSGVLQLDASDALAVAVCHAHHRDLNRLLAAQAVLP
jgi:crossover junction endodeoxyribonuclease RuvC